MDEVTLPEPAQRLLEALRLATPATIATYFDDGLNHCISACLAGVSVLERHGFTARMVARGIVCVDEAKNAVISLGMSPREVYDRVTFESRTRPSFEAWLRRGMALTPAAKDARREGLELLHTVILAEYQGTPLFLDLTMGQLRAHGVGAPLTFVRVGDKDGGVAHELSGDAWKVRYFEIERSLERWVQNAGAIATFTEELQLLTELALKCDLRAGAFYRSLHSLDHETFDRVWERLVRFGLFINYGNPSETAKSVYSEVTAP